MKHGKLLIFLCIIIIFFIIFFLPVSCDDFIIPPYGRVLVKYSMTHEEDGESIDSGIIETCTLLLKQEGEIKREVALPVSKENSTGRHLLTSIEIGDYDISIELADAAGKIHYSSEAEITITPGNNEEIKMPEFLDYFATLDFKSSEFQDIPEITRADGILLQDGTTRYTIDFDFDNQTITTIEGTISEIYPGDYDIVITFYDEGDDVVFYGTKQFTLARTTHTANIEELNQKTGWVEITMNSDGEVPEIISPGISFFCEILQPGPSDAIISCNTHMNTIVNIFFSTTQGFDYSNKPTLVVGNSQQAADTITHNARIRNFQDDQFYYYVIVAIDEQGDINVSDEYQFIISIPPSQPCVDKIIDGRPDFRDTYTEPIWDFDTPAGRSAIIADWATNLDRGGYYGEFEQYPECDCTGN